MTYLDKHVKEMKSLANTLVEKSFPKIAPNDEEDLNCLKQRDIMVDGYELVVYFNKLKYETHCMEVLQVFGKYFSFLPFNVVCKVAYKFLGSKELSFIELIHNSRKVYVWAVYYDKNDKPIKNPLKKVERCSYSGLNYSYVDKQYVNFF